MPYDASNRRDIHLAEKESRLAEKDRIQHLQTQMSTTAGRTWFHDLLEFCHLFSDPFTGDALHEAYRKGERNVGLRIFADILAHCPDSYVQMMKEANGRRILNDTRRNRDDDSDPDQPTFAELSGGEDAGWNPERRLGTPAYDP